MASNVDILKFYEFENLEKYTEKVSDYGEIENFTGEFSFKECSKCKGPLFAHVKCLAEDKTLIWSEEQSGIIIKTIVESFAFQAALAKCDKRASATTCDGCNKRLDNRMMMENHLKIVHNIQGIKIEEKMKMMQSQWNHSNYQILRC